MQKELSYRFRFSDDIPAFENSARRVRNGRFSGGRPTLIIIGPPGAGKTMLAKRMPSILPPLSMRKALETANAMERLGPSAWACNRILKGARTIADLACTKEIKIHPLAEAS